LARAKIGKEPLIVFKFSIVSLILIELNKTAVLRENRQKIPDISGDTADDRSRSSPCFPIGWRHAGKCALGPLL
jgi:hypothetical protein